MSDVDSSHWKQPVVHKVRGDEHPPPVPLVDGVREESPDPYVKDNPHVLRNFGKQ